MWLTDLLFLSLTTLALARPNEKAVNYRLPDIYRPEKYELHLSLDTNTFTGKDNEYSGSVTINFTVTEDSGEVKLHASHRDLRLNTVEVSGKTVDESDYSIDETTDILTISYSDGFTAGKSYWLTIDFTGYLTDDMDGFYKDSYQDDSGKTRYLAGTQFETISARRAFPSFDEPALKATFDIYITYALGYNAISNTPGTVVSSDSASETIKFDTTPKMSTYLIAFVVSDFTCTDGESLGGVAHRVCSRYNAKDQRPWAVEIGPQLLEHLSEFLGYNYKDFMPKMDQVAIPDYGGAMENWAIVIYSEGSLLWGNDDGTLEAKEDNTLTISHEFTHQWFGDLVTLNWWSETFLNEGLATYFEFHGANDLIPEWQLDEQFMFDVFQPILLEDSMGTTNALVSDATTPDEINGKFDGISYSKGASIIRMVRHIMGLESFKAGLNQYINAKQYSNAVAADFWNALSDNINNSVSNLPAEFPVVMDNWTFKSGFPLVQVSLNGSQVTITQEQFLINSGDSSTKWYVPISYVTSVDEDKVDTSAKAWLTPDSDLTISLQENASWIIVNVQQTGFYRVNYDDALWNSIAEALLKEDFDGIHEMNRAQIVNDLFTLARAGKIDYDRVLDLVEFLVNETAYVTWFIAFNELNYLLSMVDIHSDIGKSIASQFLRLMSTFYATVPLTEHNREDQIYNLKQALALKWACKLGDQDCIDYSKAQFASFKNNGTKLYPELKIPIICAALRASTDDSDIKFIEDLIANSNAYDKYFLTGALYCANEKESLTGHLNRTTSDKSRTKYQGTPAAIASVHNGGPVGADVAFRSFTDNYENIAKRFKNWKDAGDLFKTIASRLSTREQVEELRELIESGKLPKKFKLAGKTALALAEANLQWKEKYEEDIREYYRSKTSRKL